MEHTTAFYTDNKTGQPVRFKINKYDIDFLDEHIQVFYIKEVFNTDETECLSSENKSYIVRDEVRTVSFLDSEPTSVEPLLTPFKDWVDYVPEGVSMIQLFVGATLPKIMIIEGVS